MKVLVVAEYYPRAGAPALGIWAHRQARAALAAGAELRVLVLHRPIPPLSALRAGDARRALAPLRQPGQAVLDGLPVRYVRYLSPPRGLSYGAWGAWAAPALRRAMRALRPEFPFAVVHAHYAVPAADAVRRVDPDVPLVVSVHGHDVQGAGAGGPAVRRALAHARLVLANSAGTATRCRALASTPARVVHLGTDLPAAPAPPPERPTLVTVADLVPRKRHADVVGALARLRAAHPELRWVVVGDGPEREPLRALARSLGVLDMIELRGALPHAGAMAAAREATLFVLPSIEEAFGVAYIEAMGAGVPALGCAGEDGPEEIAAAGGGIALVPPGDPEALADQIGRLLDGQRRPRCPRRAGSRHRRPGVHLGALWDADARRLRGRRRVRRGAVAIIARRARPHHRRSRVHRRAMWPSSSLAATPTGRSSASTTSAAAAAELNLPRLREAGVQFQHADVRVLDDLLTLGELDAVLECSAEPSALAGIDGSPDYLIQSNLIGAYHCLELARRRNAYMLFLSTSRVYPIEPLSAPGLSGDRHPARARG